MSDLLTWKLLSTRMPKTITSYQEKFSTRCPSKFLLKKLACHGKSHATFAANCVIDNLLVDKYVVGKTKRNLKVLVLMVLLTIF